VTSGAQLRAAISGATILPNKRPVEGLAASPIPGDDRLALVGDPDRVEVPALDTGIDDRLSRYPPGDVPDFSRVVLDPAGAREMLLELGVGTADDATLCVEDEAGGARRPLVDREDQRETPRTIVSKPSATPVASSLPVPSRRRPIPYISATIVRACRAGSGTSSISSAAAATPS